MAFLKESNLGAVVTGNLPPTRGAHTAFDSPWVWIIRLAEVV